MVRLSFSPSVCDVKVLRYYDYFLNFQYSNPEDIIIIIIIIMIIIIIIIIIINITGIAVLSLLQICFSARSCVCISPAVSERLRRLR